MIVWLLFGVMVFDVVSGPAPPRSPPEPEPVARAVREGGDVVEVAAPPTVAGDCAMPPAYGVIT